jgi:cell division GTPase FtsZ
MKNLLISLGNCGTQIAKAVANSPRLPEEALSIYAIDSQTGNVDMDTIARINVIPIVSDEKNGSGRNRQRGEAMYKYHEENGAFDEMYKEAENSKAPVLVVTSAAGGTGSGACVPVCSALLSRGIQVIPIIICPNMEDPDAYHLNTNDLLLELADAGIETYSLFRNPKNTANYTPINNDVVKLIEIILGKCYDKTVRDSIDDSDLDVVLSLPGRFIAVAAEASNVDNLRKEITRKVLNGSQPAWTPEDSENSTLITAYSIKSAYADDDFHEVFKDINARITKAPFDQYSNIVNDDNNGEMTATVIVAGLPRGEIKIIDSQFKEASSIGAGMNKSARPSFMTRKKATISSDTKDKDGDPVKRFRWK